jgi:ectoine hydroxylase-related dioxygenase (phytanoyl-CoA dioxygenase family)
MTGSWQKPNEEDVVFYETHGWWVSSGSLSDEAIEDLLYGAERYYAGERDTAFPLELPTDWTPDKGDILRQNDYVSLQLDEFRDFLRTSPVAEAAAVLSRTKSIRLFHDQLLYKPPDVTGPKVSVGWHTDRAYWQTCTSASMISAWVPLQDCTIAMGPLMVIDKSHHWPDREEFRNFHTGDMTTLTAKQREAELEVEEVPFELRRGQVSFHHCMTMHGSYPNRTSTPRLAFAAHFQDESNRYRPARTASGKQVVHINDILCRKDSDGLPDYADPDICPLLWPRANG